MFYNHPNLGGGHVSASGDIDNIIPIYILNLAVNAWMRYELKSGAMVCIFNLDKIWQKKRFPTMDI